MAGIDPNIVLGIKQPQFRANDPMEQYSKSVALQGLLGQQDLQSLQLKQAQQGVADDDAVRAATIESGGDNARLRALLQQRGAYKQIQALDKFALEKSEKESTIKKNTAQGAKAEWEIEKGHLEHGAAMLDLAKDPESFAQVLRLGQMNGTFKPEVVAQLSAQGYSPQLVQALQQAGMTRAQQLEQQHKADTLKETGRHNVVTETETAQNHRTTERTAQGNLAVAQGNLGVSRDRLNLERDQPRGQYDADRGLIVDPRSGEARPVTQGGAPIGPKEKDAPESLLKASGYATRMTKAEQILAANADSATPTVGESAAGKLPGVGNVAANLSRSPGRQQYNQAAEDWVRAKLRQESGAVIADEEMAREIRTYFPQIGDGPEVIAQKAAARKTAQDAMTKAAGRAADKPGAPPTATQKPAKPKLGERRDGYLFKGGDPANPASWERV